MGFSRQEYWHGLPFPSPGDLPNPRIKRGSPTLQADSTVWATRAAHMLAHSPNIPDFHTQEVHFLFIHKSQQLEPLILLMFNLFQVFLVHSSSGCSNRILWTGWLLSHRSGVWKSKVKAPAWFAVWWEFSPWFTDGCLLTVSLQGGREQATLWAFSYKGTNPIHRALLLWPNHLPQAPPPNTITVGCRVPTRIWDRGGHK